MNICCECRREMRCQTNGVGADFGHGHVYPGDRFECPVCGKRIISTGNSLANHDPDHKQQREYLAVIQGQITKEERNQQEGTHGQAAAVETETDESAARES